MTDKLLIQRDGHVVTLTLNQPDLRNPITDVDFVDAFVAACADVQADMDVRYCARLFDSFGLSSAPIIEDGEVIGIVSYKELVFNGLCKLIGDQG